MFTTAILPMAKRLTVALICCLLFGASSSAWAVITVNITSPAEGASFAAGANVNYSISVSGAVVGISQIQVTRIDSTVDTYSFNPSPPTNNTVINESVVIPLSTAAGSRQLISVNVQGYADDPVNASRNVNVTGGGGDTTAPTFAGIATAVRQAGNTSVNLTWNAATDAVTNAANMRYDIYYDAVQGSVFSAGIKKTVTGVTADTVTGLTAGTTYFIGVRAKDQANNSDTNTVTLQNAPLASGPLPTPLVDLSASTLTLGSLPTWTNFGSLGGTFNTIAGQFRFVGDPVVEEVSGRRAATFNSNGLVATVSPPATITGAAATATVVFQSYNPDFTSNPGPGGYTAGVEVALEWGTRAAGQWAGWSIGNTQAWNAISFFGGGNDFPYSTPNNPSLLSPSAGAWHVSVLTFNGATGQATAYVDGVQTNQATLGATNPINIVGVPFCMGGTQEVVNAANTTPNRNVTASFARVQVYDTVLTADQVTQLTNALTALPPAPNAAENWMLYN